MKILLFTNPAKRARARVSKAKSILGKHATVITAATGKPYDTRFIAERIRATGCDTVIAAGGDGFLNDVLNGLLNSGRQVPLGLIPAGSMNIFAASAGIARNLEEACKIILAGKTARLDTGKIDSGNCRRYFLCWAGAGFDTHVIKRVASAPSLKNSVGGLLAHLAAGSSALFTYRGDSFTARVDDKTYECCNIIASNIALYAMRKLHLVKNADMQDGLLDIVLFRGGKRLDIVRYIAALAAGAHMKLKDVEHVKTAEITLEAGKAVPVHADAEVTGLNLPVKISVLPGAIEFLLPA